MKIINFGSLNIDKVYKTKAFVNPGETVSATGYDIFPGGKGLNQSVACARAGASVVCAGIIGKEGRFLKEMLEDSGADTSFLEESDAPQGHAVIEVDEAGQNRIIVFGGTNLLLTKKYVDLVLAAGAAGDIVLLQNETNLIGSIIKKAHALNLAVAFNPSPMPDRPESLPLDMVDYFLVNEIEGAALAGTPGGCPFDEILGILSEKYPCAAIIMTLGSSGVMYKRGSETFIQKSFRVPVKDTTAAGDTFCGFFLGALCRNSSVPLALKEACAAAAIAVSRPGAAPSIPKYSEVIDFLKAGRLT